LDQVYDDTTRRDGLGGYRDGTLKRRLQTPRYDTTRHDTTTQRHNTMTTAAASLAALAGLAAWVDGKYHVRQDVAALRFKKGAERWYAELGTS
jgi:hypothetical protein